MFEYFVMNEDFNRGVIEPFNIFCNWSLDEAVQKEVKKYLRAPGKYKSETFSGETFYGFEGFCEKLRRLIMWAEWGRCEYEILVSSLFDKEGKTVRKIDCYTQCEKNIPMIAREVIYQWKHRKDKTDEI